MSIQAEPAQLVSVKLTDKLTSKSTHYIFKVENGKVKIEHGMCSGPFHFEDAASYEASFAILDARRRRNESTMPVSFKKPG